MRIPIQTILAATMVAAAMATAAGAQEGAARSAPTRAGIVGDLQRDINGVHQKLVALARAMPADKYNWRPGEGVRSVQEVFMHVASDNYFMPTFMGIAAPEETGIKTGDYASAGAFEHRPFSRDEVIAELDRSFMYLDKVLTETPESKLSSDISMFGMKMTTQSALVLTTTHVHEHLGQAIAYARMNNVVPPWSK